MKPSIVVADLRASDAAELERMHAVIAAFREHATTCRTCRSIVTPDAVRPTICDQGLTLLAAGLPPERENLARLALRAVLAGARARFGVAGVMAIGLPLLVVDVIGLWAVAQSAGGREPSGVVAVCAVLMCLQALAYIIAELPRIVMGRR